MTPTDKLNQKNKKAIQRMRKGIAESAKLQNEVRDGKKTASQALKEKCGK